MLTAMSSEEIRERCKKLGIPLSRLAERMGMSRQALHQILSNSNSDKACYRGRLLCSYILNDYMTSRSRIVGERGDKT